MTAVADIALPSGLAATYLGALRGQRRRGLTFVVLSSASGIFEGLALAALVPLVQTDFSEQTHELLSRTVTSDELQVLVLVGFAAGSIGSVLLRFASEAVLIRLRSELERGLRMQTTDLLLRADWSAFLLLRLGDINASMLMSAEQIGLGAISFLRGGASLFIAFGFGLAAVVAAPNLSLVAFVFALLALLGYRYSGARSERHSARRASLANAIGRDIGQVFGNLKLFRSTGGVERAHRQMLDTYAQFADAYRRAEIYRPATRLGFEVGAALVLVILLGLSFVTTGEFSGGTLAFLMFFYRLAPRALNAQEFMQAAVAMRPWYLGWEAERSRLAATVVDVAPGRPPTFGQAIEARSLGYRYDGADRNAVEGADWDLRPGECIAFVGPSGCGKTTMLDLTTGLLTPTSGSLLVDGEAIQSLDREAWQARLGLVMQDSPLFHGSVLDNVCWGLPIDREKAIACLDRANCTDFVAQLPDGVDTVLGESGATLSGGQRQRLALARSLYGDPWLVLLDEATSALDRDAERAVIDGLRELKQATSVILVTHRVPILEIADRIYVMDGGSVVAQRTWAELARTPERQVRAMVGDEEPSEGSARGH